MKTPRFREVRNPTEEVSEWDSGWRYAVAVSAAVVVLGIVLSLTYVATKLMESL